MITWKESHHHFFYKMHFIHRDLKKTGFLRCMLYRHNAAIGTDWNLVFWDDSLYNIQDIGISHVYITDYMSWV